MAPGMVLPSLGLVSMSRPSTLPIPWCYLADQCGGVSLLAAHLRVDRSTLKHWAHGHFLPCKAHEEAILDLCDSLNLPHPTFER